MGGGVSSGVATMVSAASDSDLETVLSDLSPDGRERLMTALVTVDTKPHVITREKRAAEKAADRLATLPNMDPELVAQLSASDTADTIFAALDANGDGLVCLNALQDYLMARDAWLMKEDVAALYDALGANIAGGLTLPSLRAALCRVVPDGEPQPLWLPLRVMALLPALPGKAVFADLVRPAGVPVDIPEAAYRAMTLRQLRAVARHARTQCSATGWLGARFVDGRMRHEKLKVEDINLYHVNAHIVLPFCKAHQLQDGSTRPSYVELVAEGDQRPDVFVSHFWGEPIADFTACIAQSTRDLEYGGGKFVTHKDHGNQQPSDGLNARVWVCAYANRQWDLGGDLTDDPRQTSFARAMRLAKATIAIVDTAGMYFRRVWCCFEIFMSLQMNEIERDATARRDGPYKYHVYTKLTHTPVKTKTSQFGERQAVGIVDGVAPADTGYAGDEDEATFKAIREAPFPKALLRLALVARVEEGAASVASDRTHILNCIVGGGRDMNAEMAAAHERYDEVNATLHGRVAGDALRPAIEEGGEVLDTALSVLRTSSVKRVGVTLHNCPEATAEVMARVVAALPASLEVLALRRSKELRMAPRLAELARLKTLDLGGCEKLEVLPDLSGHTQLETLDLFFCKKLKAVPDLSKLTRLETVDLHECRSLSAIPDVSSLPRLTQFRKPQHLKK